ncbi:hypothetical protein ABL78_3248 [Leptomonas seymouri]|uniref:DUF1935 domain-containing protein n=1 Tax=Leptomonas seymouri TaxID=5684 RepID=A0A0N1I505_LEPSE|nr:hypothetical protein ABL78_3248 [Leptomonas seymouri]|eukprot:KPI87650.1 hypothetical protein ABL78_3248 [Leptomonas seymouri]
MTEAVPVDSVHFVNGEPLCAFQECYRCFEGRDILYRLVNAQKKQWFFYNNTVDTIMHIRAVFSPGSVIKPLQRATLCVLPNATGLPDETCSIEVTLDVEPGYTESFIEGDVKGFKFEFRTETAPAKDVVFEFRRPTEHYDKIYKCFKNNGNGLLFRLVDDTAHRWCFYNDTRDFMMKVSVTFADGTEVRPLGSTVVSAAPPETGEKSICCVLLIAPGQTEPFIEGKPITYTLDFAAEPMPVPAHSKRVEEPVHYLHGSPDATVIPHQSHVYKCFKDHGNGLLFRIVDDHHNIWAFYNDTTEYVMTAHMRYPHSNRVHVAPGVQVIADAEREGGMVAAVEVPPLATMPFLVGTPAAYELAFSAIPVQSSSPETPPTRSVEPGALNLPRREASESGDGISSYLPLELAPVSAATAAQPLPHASEPEEAPLYESGHPDATIFPHIDEVFKCFKEHGNGLLFRLVDKANRRWAFYNDTTDIVATVQVEFHPKAQIELLGRTEVATNPETGNAVYTLRVAPLETAPFVQGDVDAFTMKFMAESIDK